MIRVVLAEDHEMVRAGLEELLGGAEDIEVVGVAADGEEAVALAKETEPDVVLCDLSMPRLDGIAATQGILEADRRPRLSSSRRSRSARASLAPSTRARLATC